MISYFFKHKVVNISQGTLPVTCKMLGNTEDCTFFYNTFMADNCTNRKNVTESAINHIYITKEMEDRKKAEIARKDCLKKGPKVVWKRRMKLIYSYYYYLALALAMALAITICNILSLQNQLCNLRE